MNVEERLGWLLPILERRAYPAKVNDREAAARLAAIANLPVGWVIDDADWSGN